MIDDEMYDLIVIGAGASGLFSAISAKNNGAEKVLILEKTDPEYVNFEFDSYWFTPLCLHAICI